MTPPCLNKKIPGSQPFFFFFRTHVSPKKEKVSARPAQSRTFSALLQRLLLGQKPISLHNFPKIYFQERLKRKKSFFMLLFFLPQLVGGLHAANEPWQLTGGGGFSPFSTHSLTHSLTPFKKPPPSSRPGIFFLITKKNSSLRNFSCSFFFFCRREFNFPSSQDEFFFFFFIFYT